MLEFVAGQERKEHISIWRALSYESLGHYAWHVASICGVNHVEHTTYEEALAHAQKWKKGFELNNIQCDITLDLVVSLACSNLSLAQLEKLAILEKFLSD